MKIFGSITELDTVVFREDGVTLTVQPNSGVTYTGSPVLQLPNLNGSDVILSRTSTDTVTNKTIDANNNTISNLAHGAEVDNPSSGVHGVAGSVVGTTDTQTLSNKTLTLPKINDTSADHQYIFGVSELIANRTIALPLLTGNDTFVFEAHVQTLTGKTLTLPKVNEAVDLTATSTELNQLDGVTVGGIAAGDILTTAGTQVVTNKTFTDSSTTFQDNADTSKKFQFQVSGVTTATTRTYTVPDADTTLVGTDATQTLTGKTIDADLNTLSNIENADIKAAAGIVYSKLTLTGSIINADIAAAAAIARSKLAAGTANHVVVNDGSGNFSSEANLAISRGGTGQATAAAGFDALAPTTTNEDLIIRRAGTNTRLGIGAEGQVLKVVSGQLAYGTGGGDVTASATITDNAVVRGDGGAKGVQSSGVLLDDSDHFNFIESLRNLSQRLTNDVSYTVETGYGQVSEQYEIATATTITVDTSARWSIFDVLTITGTLVSTGTTTVRS